MLVGAIGCLALLLLVQLPPVAIRSKDLRPGMQSYYEAQAQATYQPSPIPEANERRMPEGPLLQADPERELEAMRHEMSERLGIVIEVADTPANNLQGADVICTATSSSQPVVPETGVPPGVHINAVGAYRPDMAEIPPAIVSQSRVVVDHLDSALEEAGDLLQPLHQGLIQPSHIAVELGELVLGQTSGRANSDEITLFKSVGVAIQDLYAAASALENARRLGLGVSLS